MKLKEFDILLDIKKNKKIEDIEVVQKDYESNVFNISIVEDFEPYNLTGLDVEIAFAKADGTTVLQDENNGITITNTIEGKIICVLKTNTIAAPGRVHAEVRILEGDKLLTTSRFNFFVRRAIVNDETVESTNEFPILNQKIQEADDLIEEIKSKPAIKGDKGDRGPKGDKGDRGPKGDKGDTGSIDNLDSQDVIGALGYTPADDKRFYQRYDGDLNNLDEVGFYYGYNNENAPSANTYYYIIVLNALANQTLQVVIRGGSNINFQRMYIRQFYNGAWLDWGRIAIDGDISTSATSIALGWNSSSTSKEYSTAIGGNSTATELGSVALGRQSSATGYASLALGDSAEAKGDGTIKGGGSVAIGVNSISTNAHEGVLGTSGANDTNKWIVPGNFTVEGTKNFEIPHPRPEKKSTHRIRHGAVESPTAGDTLYRYKTTATKDNDIVTVDLPDYLIYLNKDVQIFVTPQGHFGNGYGILNRENEQLEIHCQYEGEYNVLVIGTRNDDHQSVQDWGIKSVEREIGESWTGETYVFEVDEIMEVEEIKEVV